MEAIIIVSLLVAYFVPLGIIYLIPIGNKFIKNFSDGCNLSKETTGTLKGVLIIGIMISHIALRSSYFQTDIISNLAFKAILIILGNLGTIGVSGFYVLSGYGNGYSLDKCMSRLQVTMWFWKRVKKIIITFLICYMVVVYFDFFVYGHKYTSSKIVQEVCTLTIPDTTTWYLKIQMLLYVFTFLIMIITMNRKVTGIGITVLCILYVIWAKYIMDLDGYWWNTVICYPVGYYINLYMRQMQLFLLHNIRKSTLFITILGIVAFLVTVIFPNQFIFQILAFTIIGTVIIIMAQVAERKITICEKLGNISFELYLIHIGLVSIVIPQYELVVSQVILFLVLSITFSYISYLLKQLLEKRFIK